MDNYEQKYNDALERARYYHSKDYMLINSAIENIFPELAESEDERIRKDIISYLRNEKIVKRYISDIEIDKWIVWLEKQGESEDKGSDDELTWLKTFIEEEAYYLSMDIRDEVDREKLIKLQNALAWLEKQGEQPTDKVEPKFHEGDIVQYITDSTDRRKIEEIDTLCNMYHTDSSPIMFDVENEWKVVVNAEDVEEESVDKVEPKFHEGEWLCENEPNNYARFIQILETVNVQGKERYRISRDIHNDEDIVEFGFIEKYYHKFDIQDAKDGDIVYFECHAKHLFIVKSVGETKDHVEGHFWYNITRNECEIWDGRLPYSNIASMWDAMPATKEQRDLLFTKMKEAGYEWNSEKKELKKVGSKTFNE